MSAPKTYEAFEHVAQFISECKAALADGWQPAQDIPDLLSDMVKDLIPLVGDADDIVKEFKADPTSCWIEVARGSAKLLEAILSKE